MQEWERRQAHADAFKRAFDESGCTYFPNGKTLRRYNGKAFWEAFNAAGHDAVDCARCSCQRN